MTYSIQIYGTTAAVFGDEDTALQQYRRWQEVYGRDIVSIERNDRDPITARKDSSRTGCRPASCPVARSIPAKRNAALADEESHRYGRLMALEYRHAY